MGEAVPWWQRARYAWFMGPVQRAWWQWRTWQVSFVVCMWLALTVFWMLLHGANAYPRELAKAEAALRDAQRIWFDICKEGREAVPKRIPCAQAHEEIHMQPRRIALERAMELVMADTVHTFNPLYYVQCSEQCRYVLVKCVDSIFSSVWMGLSLLALCLCALAFAIYRGVQAYSTLQWERALRSHRCDPEPASANVTLKTEHTPEYINKLVQREGHPDAY